MRRSFSPVAIVNRGEAALRFIHAARELNRRPRDVGSVHEIIPARRLRPYLVGAVERGMRKELERLKTAAGDWVPWSGITVSQRER